MTSTTPETPDTSDTAPDSAAPPSGAPRNLGAPAARPGERRSAVRSLLRLWPFVRPVRWRLFGAVGVAVTASCLGLLIPLILKWIVDGPIAAREVGGIWLGGALLLGVGVVEALLFGVRRWLVARPLAGVEASLRGTLYARLQRLPVSFHDGWAGGQLLSRGTTDLQLLRMFLAFPLTFLFVNGTTIAVGCAILLAQDWFLGLVLLAPVPPLIWLCSVFEVRYARSARLARDQVGDLTTLMEEAVLGVRVIKGFGQHRSQARAFRTLAERLLHTELRKARLLGGILMTVMGLPELAIGAALILGTLQVAEGALSAGTLVAFLSTALALRWPVESIGFLLALCNDAATATDRYFEVLDGPPGEDEEHPGSSAPPGVAAPERPPDGLRFESVAFAFPDTPPGAPPVLDGVDLAIPPGETLALVGATGSGKTTLTALVPRLHELTGGRITLDGADIHALPRRELRRRVAVAFEEPTLFSATVAENIRLGAPEAELADVRRALRVAQAEEFVAALPQGVHTQVGEQGLSLSGGQRQRLALARAVVGTPRFLLLDDPLSALDVHTEAAVEEALRAVLATTTALVVAHRPSTVLLADRVALLSGGRIVEVGTHRALLHRNAEYATLMAGAGERSSKGAEPWGEEGGTVRESHPKASTSEASRERSEGRQGK